MNDVAAANAPQPTLLCVDDEANILSSLRRLLRPHGYRVLTAASGAEGLQLLEQEPVELVISDMRMPNMTGAEFLAEVRRRWPDTVRMLLTGYADVESTVAAINKGEIYRYIAKPWDDTDVVLQIRHALERKALEREKARLEALTLKQNEELRELNASLEAKVQERTRDLQRALESLSAANERLKGNFVNTIKLFSNLMELRFGAMAGHSRRVADLGRQLAAKLDMERAAAQDVTFAGLLHDIGKIGLPDTLLGKPEKSLSGEEFAEMRKHPIKGESVLMGIEELRGAAKLLRSHHERFDGMGYPDGLRGLETPLGARVLAVANDYDALQMGTLINKSLSPREALTFIQEGRGRRYDPHVVDALVALLGTPPEPTSSHEVSLRPKQLVPGMVLSRDLVARDGVLLLASDYLLEDKLIHQIQEYEKMEGIALTVYVRADRT